MSQMNDADRQLETALTGLFQQKVTENRSTMRYWPAVSDRLGEQVSRRPWEYVMDALNRPSVPFKTRYIYAAGSALVVVIAVLLLVLLLNTDDEESGGSIPANSPELSVPDGSYERVISWDGALTISDFETVGIKTTRQYDVTNLWGAIDAWFGFRRLGGTDPVEFELRFYTDHSSAVSNGSFYAEDVTGEGANLNSTNAAWNERIQDRVIRVQEGAGKVINPKYSDYAIYGNIVMLCEGKTIAESQAACNWLIDQLDQ